MGDGALFVVGADLAKAPEVLLPAYDDARGVTAAFNRNLLARIDFVRVVDGILVEHWDVVEDEASQIESKSGRPMFGDRFSA